MIADEAKAREAKEHHRPGRRLGNYRGCRRELDLFELLKALSSGLRRGNGNRHQFKRFAVVRNNSKAVEIGVRPLDPGEGSRSSLPITVGPIDVDLGRPLEPGSCKLTAEREAVEERIIRRV